MGRFTITYTAAIEKLIQLHQPPPPPSPVKVEEDEDHEDEVIVVEDNKSATSDQVTSIDLQEKNEESTTPLCVEIVKPKPASIAGERSSSRLSAVCLGESCRKRAPDDCIHK